MQWWMATPVENQQNTRLWYIPGEVSRLLGQCSHRRDVLLPSLWLLVQIDSQEWTFPEIEILTVFPLRRIPNRNRSKDFCGGHVPPTILEKCSGICLESLLPVKINKSYCCQLCWGSRSEPGANLEATRTLLGPIWVRSLLTKAIVGFLDECCLHQVLHHRRKVNMVRPPSQLTKVHPKWKETDEEEIPTANLETAQESTDQRAMLIFILKHSEKPAKALRVQLQ